MHPFNDLTRRAEAAEPSGRNSEDPRGASDAGAPADGAPDGDGPDVETRFASAGSTRERLLDAAGTIFAEQGFRAATVREICDRAGANVAAVHYHFHDKAQLYAAVLQHAHGCALQRFPAHDAAAAASTSAEQRLLFFVRAFLQRIFDGGQPAWFGKLIAREMIEPTPALDALVTSSIRPQCETLMGIVRELLGAAATDERVRWSAGSIVGQCVFYHHSRPVVVRLFPEQRYAPQDIARLAEHIAGFSALALSAMRAAAEGGPDRGAPGGSRDLAGGSSDPLDVARGGSGPREVTRAGIASPRGTP
jgi:TetR/AcrR family transcriptional regulator, regulator of cefoperazone and chloramphenicol sensitivity